MPSIADSLIQGLLQIWYLPLILIVLGLIKIYFLRLEKKFKQKRKEKEIHQHIKMVDEQKEKYRKDKEQKLKEEKLR
jgi:cytochrome c-type biogenesis protein CcmH/NrfF